MGAVSLGRLRSSYPATAPRGIPRAVWNALAVVSAALLAYVIWRAYQNPDFVLEFGAYMLC
jgi:hypothetical protein